MNILVKPLLILLGVLLVVAAAVMAWQHIEIGSLQTKVDTAQAQAIASQFDAQSASLNIKTVTQFTDRLIVVHDTTNSIQLQVPAYVPPSTDRAFPLPLGFVRLHDAAATGVPEVDGPGPADAEPSTIAASTALSVIVGNYGTCHETTEQLIALQDWERQREANEAKLP